MLATKDLILPVSCFVLGNNSSITLWKNKWSGNIHLLNSLSGLYSQALDKEAMVKDTFRKKEFRPILCFFGIYSIEIGVIYYWGCWMDGASNKIGWRNRRGVGLLPNLSLHCFLLIMKYSTPVGLYIHKQIRCGWPRPCKSPKVAMLT